MILVKFIQSVSSLPQGNTKGVEEMQNFASYACGDIAGFPTIYGQSLIDLGLAEAYDDGAGLGVLVTPATQSIGETAYWANN